MHYVHIHQSYKLRKGGTVGYTSRLREGFSEAGISVDDRIRFLAPTSDYLNFNKVQPRVLHKMAYAVNKRRANIHEFLFAARRWNSLRLPSDIARQIGNDIQSIAIHGVYNVPYVDHYLRRRFGSRKILKMLTTHDAIPHHMMQDENWMQSAFKARPAEYAELFARFKARDREAIQKSDILIFPCKEAMDGYFLWDEFEGLIKDKDIRYIITGSTPLDAPKPPELVRSYYGLSPDDFVVTYVGNQLKVRGFDTITEAARLLWNNGVNVKFLVAGAKGNVTPPADARWVDIGFTDDPGSVIHAGDVYLSAGPQAYFDLVTLEVLSLGTALVMSDVGGNTYFHGKSEGIAFFPPGDAPALAQSILALRDASPATRQRMGEANAALYAAEFTPADFARRYLDLITTIHKDYQL